MKAHFILYVPDQERSTNFYTAALGIRPRLHVPGMTEFEVGAGAVLGIMPADSARRLLGGKEIGGREIRAEVYLIVDDANAFHRRALAAGAEEVSPLAKRDWGHSAAYSITPDGHVLAFAQED